MPFTVDRNGRPIYPQIPFGFGAAMNAPYGRPDSDSGYGDDRSGVAQPLSAWTGAPPQPQTVQDGSDTPRYRNYSPVPMFPDVFSEWRKLFQHSMMGMLHAVRPPSNTSGMGADTPECRDEWRKARNWCADELEKWAPGPGTGGYRNLADCARGQVSVHCGGNNLDRTIPEPPKPGGDWHDVPRKIRTSVRGDDDYPDDDDDCNREWDDARRRCDEMMRTPGMNTETTGGYLNIDDCSRMFVSRRCGGGDQPNRPSPKYFPRNPRNTRR